MNMNINPCVQDDDGATALMYAAKNPDLINVVNYLCNKPNCINMVDKKLETALFYAVRNIPAFRALINSSINVNSLNIDNDSVLTYCCKYRIYDCFKTLSVVKSLDYNIFNNDDMTAALYLIRDENSEDLKNIINKNMNFYYMNKDNISPITLLFKKYDKYYKNGEIDNIVQLCKIIKLLVDNGISLNVSIDENGNTPLMYLMMVEDWCSVLYIILHSNDIDLTIKNDKGENAILLASKFSQKKYNDNIKKAFHFSVSHFFKLLFKRINVKELSEFDKNGYNLLMYSAYFNSKEYASCLVENIFSLASETNKNQENALIMCSKLGSVDVANEILDCSDINHKDCYGNTALHYSVQINEYYIANLLAYKKADINIKNDEGVSPLALAKDDKNMTNFLTKPIFDYKLKKLQKKKKSDFAPINESLQNKYREAYASDMFIKPDYKINNAINQNLFFEKILKSYFTLSTTKAGRAFDVSFRVFDRNYDTYDIFIPNTESVIKYNI